MDTIEVVIENTRIRKTIKQGTTLTTLAQEYYTEQGQWPPEHCVLGALVNNVVEDMNYRIYNPKTIRFFDITDPQGRRMYQSSLIFMLYKAVREIYPQAVLSVKHSMQGGFYCTIENAGEETPFAIATKVRDRMIELQKENIPFESKVMLLTDAIELVKEAHIPETQKLLESLGQLYITMNYLGGTVHKFHTKLVPCTGCLRSWDFRTYSDSGFLLQMPDTKHFEKMPLLPDTPKLFSIFKEHHRWVDLLHVPTITDLNRIVRDKGENHLIHVAEALHEKKYAEIADMIYQRRDQVRMVLLAGPSSSGKTTSCRRLSVQLSVLGFDVKQLSLDDYFVCRERTPKLPNGEFDFESVDALDIPLLNEHLQRLFNGERVEIPTFDFIKGNPYFDGKSLQLGPNSILLVEGIHALNPKLTAQIDDALKFRVYVSALTQIAIDNVNMIHTNENRMLRRIVRDNNFRGWDAYNTLHRWSEVRRGEAINIFPFQENADVMFNSALLYEIGVLKIYAEPQLKHVPENCEEFAEATHLLKFLNFFDPIDPKYIPPTSIMREFLGGSSFSY
ncbi:MAG: nucleoside kinase [Bacteroidales bacterium]|nr:nucleoside kinase [Bacteroidales bacterium]